MKLKINGKEEIINSEELTIVDLLKIKEVKMPDMVSVQLNEEIINREDYSKIKLKDNDEIDFLYFMGGGNYIGFATKAIHSGFKNDGEKRDKGTLTGGRR